MAYKLILISVLLKLIAGAEKLSSYNVNPADTSVSGLSAGAIMATQVQVAFSSHIKGAGIIAGVPYNCGAQRDTGCTTSTSPAISTSIARVKSWSADKIDDISNLSKHRVYLLSGTLDTTVMTSIMNQVYKFYVTDSQLIPASNVEYKKDLKSAHTFPTDFDSAGNNGCSQAVSPYISNCGFDAVEAILRHIYGKLNPKTSGALTGAYVSFDQNEFLADAKNNGMDATGYAYVPKSCADRQLCKLHIAFHGCTQGYAVIGDKFVRNTGYARWADSNQMIVVFPQAVANSVTSINVSNPNGCWDWMGWYGSDFDTRSGKQLSAVKKIIDRVTDGFVRM